MASSSSQLRHRKKDKKRRSQVWITEHQHKYKSYDNIGNNMITQAGPEFSNYYEFSSRRDGGEDKKKLILGKYKTLEEVPREVSLYNKYFNSIRD